MSTKAAVASGFVIAALVLAVTWAFEISLSRAALQRRPWLVAGIAVAAFALIAALSLLGLELPRE